MEEGFEIVYLKFPIAHKLMGEFRVGTCNPKS
jgi:hypothetical protein